MRAMVGESVCERAQRREVPSVRASVSERSEANCVDGTRARWSRPEGVAACLRRVAPATDRAQRGKLAGSTGLEPAASGVTGRRSNQLNYDPRTGVALPVRQNLPECQSDEGWWAVQDSNL